MRANEQDVADALRSLARESADEGARGPEACDVERALGLRRTGGSGQRFEGARVERLADLLDPVADGGETPGGYCRCGACGRTWSMGGGDIAWYCPHCRARLRG